MIEGQPRDDDIVAGELGGLGHEGHRPRDIGMTEDHPARKARASRRVLDEGDVILGDRGKGGRRIVDLEILGLEDMTEVARPRLAFLDVLAEPADGGDGLGLGVPEHVGGGLDAERRVDRHGHGPHAQEAQEREEELLAGGIDEAHLVALVDAGPAEPRRVPRALAPERAVGHRLVVDVEVGGVRLRRDPLPQKLHERGCHLLGHPGCPPR